MNAGCGASAKLGLGDFLFPQLLTLATKQGNIQHTLSFGTGWRCSPWWTTSHRLQASSHRTHPYRCFVVGASLLAMQPLMDHKPSLAGKLPQNSPVPLFRCRSQPAGDAALDGPQAIACRQAPTESDLCCQKLQNLSGPIYRSEHRWFNADQKVAATRCRRCLTMAAIHLSCGRKTSSTRQSPQKSIRPTRLPAKSDP